MARRYAGRGEPLEDLIQVAALGLVNAVDRYDHNRQAAFASFAVPTILGCLKRHFRDTAWGMRVPRSTQELGRDVAVAVGELSQLRGRPPTSAELATHLQTSPDAVAVALAAGGVYRPASLNAPQAGSGGLALIDLLGGIDPRYTDVDDHLDLRSMVAALPVRERRILTMRFTDGMTQHDIAVEVGVSQMQVSRLLAQSLTRLRAVMAGPSATTRCPPIATNTTNPGQDRFNRG
jgi:RNA polymerase sigma-B factor